MAVYEFPTYPERLRDLEAEKRAEKDASRNERWARAAFEDEVKNVANAEKGTRNNTLNTAALKLGHKVAAGYLYEGDVLTALFGAAIECGLAQEDNAEAVFATIRSGLSAGMREPEHPRDRTVFQTSRKGSTMVQPDATRDSRFYSAATLKGKSVPPRQWLVDGLVPDKTVTLFSGDGGTGKSLLALQLAVAVVAGTGWIGKAVSNGGAIFLSAEDDDDELHRRTDDILRAEGRSYDDLSGLTLRSLAGEDALLAVETKIALTKSELFAELDARAADEAPALIVIDTLADVYPANENDRAKVRQFVGILRGLAIKRRCAVVLLGHPSLTGLSSGSGASGSTAWNNSVRSRLYLSRIADSGFEPDPDARVLSTKKANYGRTGGEINLKWKAGVFAAEAQPAGLDALAVGAKSERVFLKLLDAFEAQGRYVSASPGPTYAPTQFASHPDAEGCTKRVLKGAMDTLFNRGVIFVASHGAGAKARSHIARKGADDGQE
ncbi:AAA family ATPase [Psychromarinibacter sp. S121]|uniref:AAA family ATPase n=1 Tax=Psychromarinibacter sp. S121 TaxID=3415127 RepID=UPI003C79FE1C